MKPRGMAARIAGLAAVLAALMLCAVASAHVERPSFWPLPQADCSIHPCAGGAVPAPRPLSSALRRTRGSTTRVVCQPSSLRRLNASIRRARRAGYWIRPTDHRTLSAKSARALLRLNRRLFHRCRYRNIQPAVTASHNNDRVVIMPGLYTEPESRAKPTNDPRCAPYKITDNQGGDIVGAVSYPYQFYCPNDQNLIAVIGRALGPGTDPHPPPLDRHGIPNRGRCIRCNLQIEGSGVSADDVVIDAGRAASGDGPPIGAAKDVGLRADRADGFVLRGVTVRHAKEHDIYVLEANGYVLDRFKAYWAGEYGVLTFVEDHGLMQNCDAAGSGDAGLYPGAGAKTSAGRDTRFYPQFRYSQEIRFCDSHHNLAGYSGTDGNAVQVDHDNFFDNTLGFSTDVFTAAGHPGFPQQGDLIEYSNFYSNNFNPYGAGSPLAPSEPEPVGTGMWFAGGNDNIVRFNRFYDNWRRGAMLFAAPDVFICGPGGYAKIPVPGCDPAQASTSYRNRFYENTMGVAPDGSVRPNGTDFWWDGWVGNTGDCWYRNHPAPGRGITDSPPGLPDCADGTNPALSIGLGSANEGELAQCLASIQASAGYDPRLCPWFTTPPRPS